jgi:hypothetical protein
MSGALDDLANQPLLCPGASFAQIDLALVCCRARARLSPSSSLLLSLGH